MNTNSSPGSNVTSNSSDTKYNDFIVKAFIISAFVWGIAAMLIGVIIAFQLVFPQLPFRPGQRDLAGAVELFAVF